MLESGAELCEVMFRTVESLGRWQIEINAGEIEDADLGEFDNRAHDWLRS
jgi:hypothetical protein